MFSSKCCTPLMKATKNVTWRLLFDVTCLNARPSDSRVFILGVVVLDVCGSKVLYCCLYSSRPLTCVFVYVQILALFHLSMYNVIIVSTFNTTSAIKHCTVCVCPPVRNRMCLLSNLTADNMQNSEILWNCTEGAGVRSGHSHWSLNITTTIFKPWDFPLWPFHGGNPELQHRLIPKYVSLFIRVYFSTRGFLPFRCFSSFKTLEWFKWPWIKDHLCVTFETLHN